MYNPPNAINGQMYNIKTGSFSITIAVSSSNPFRQTDAMMYKTLPIHPNKYQNFKISNIISRFEVC